MKLSNISLDELASLKGRSRITLTCDGCQGEISREVKEIRRCIKNGKTSAFCSNKCQGETLKINKTKQCEYCKTDFTYNFPTQKYCSKSCSNSNRVLSEESKDKISSSLSGKRRTSTPNRGMYRYSELEYCSINTCSCSHCGLVGSYHMQQKYCESCKDMYYNGRTRFLFTFNVYDYPDLFDLDLITKYGWRTTKGESINVNGVSRDHKVSVNEAIKNDYDPYYIKHPLNCELMLHSDNQSKGTNSSISYNELVTLVDLYDQK